MIRERSNGRFEVFVQENGKKKYVGMYRSREEAEEGERRGWAKANTPQGRPIRLRVTAIYGNGCERELTEFPVSEEGLTAFATENEEYVAFLAQLPREQDAPTEDVIFEADDPSVPF